MGSSSTPPGSRAGGVGAEIGDQVDEQAVAAFFADGATVVLQALHRVWPPIADFAIQLAADLGHPVQVNAYVTPPSSRGFSAHYDLHDVFVLQLAGEKRWIVHEPVLEAPLRSQPWTQRRGEVEAAAATGGPALDVVLTPGDALYLPRGFLHAAEALGEISAHLTVGVHVLTRHAVVQALVELAEDELELRRSLPLGIDVAEPADVGRNWTPSSTPCGGCSSPRPPWTSPTGCVRARGGRCDRVRSHPSRRRPPSSTFGPATRFGYAPACAPRSATTARSDCSFHTAGSTSSRRSAAALRPLLDGDVVVVADEERPGPAARARQRLLREGVIVPAGA